MMICLLVLQPCQPLVRLSGSAPSSSSYDIADSNIVPLALVLCEHRAQGTKFSFFSWRNLYNVVIAFFPSSLRYQKFQSGKPDPLAGGLQKLFNTAQTLGSVVGYTAPERCLESSDSCVPGSPILWAAITPIGL
jgi:hypothetical protein